MFVFSKWLSLASAGRGFGLMVALRITVLGQTNEGLSTVESISEEFRITASKMKVEPGSASRFHVTVGAPQDGLPGLSSFSQSAVKQSAEPARIGPDPKLPY